jgi:hypothetical protein
VRFLKNCPQAEKIRFFDAVNRRIFYQKAELFVGFECKNALFRNMVFNVRNLNL